MGLSPLNKNTPELKDAFWSGLAQRFLSFPEDPTPGSEALDTRQLDFSVNSLVVIEQHLGVMRLRKLEDQAFIKFVMRCGAYVGEVVRQNAKNNVYHWVPYKEAVNLNKIVGDFGENLGTSGILWDGKGGFFFPLGKVMKCLQNASEAGVNFFAQVILREYDKA